jgi:hypothetical protein
VSDQDQPASGEPTFDDPAFDELRALLAETRVTEPVPADVAARLDTTLASLRDQRRAGADRPDASVLVLRRRVGRVLVAAAAVAVVVAGSFGIVQSSRNGTDGADSASSVAADEGSADKAAPQEPTERQPEAVTGSAAVAPQLTRAHFAHDAAAAMRTLSTTEGTLDSASSSPSAPVPGSPDPTDTDGDFAANGSKAAQAPPITATPEPLRDPATLRGSAGCAGPAAPDAVTLPATLDGVPVALVFRPPTASAQVVEAWSCDGASLLASATVPH